MSAKMRTLRSSTLLRCFYCGRKSKFRFNGQRSFDCADCEATNWLDENGEITDPPSQPESPKQNTIQYAIPRSSAIRSPSPTALETNSHGDASLFCTKCQRNQHMLNSSLAQFEWPEDPTTAEYAARERRYWSLKKDLEKRYPQICSECKPKVDQKLHQASYTAKTDHLRRMMDRTRSQRKEVKKRGFLDLLDALGKLSWYTAFVLQATWHLVVVSFLVTDRFSSGEGGSYVFVLLATFHRVAGFAMPYTDKLMQWAINLSMCSFPWNPRFKQSIRGFTAHILGFRQWYTYQLLTLIMRLICISLSQYSKSQGLSIPAQLGIQVVIPVFMLHIYKVAKRVIRTDTTPLFRQSAPLPSLTRSDDDSKTVAKDSSDLGSILDDILDEPSSQQAREIHASQSPRRVHNYATSPISRDYQRGGDNSRSSAANPTLGALSLSDSVNSPNYTPSATHYDEEMDWSPSASQHRAFSSYNTYNIKNTNPRFGDLRTEPKSGPIWYKVPPAPTNPAQRIRNPTRPVIRESPKEIKDTFFQRARQDRQVNFGSASEAKPSGFDLAKPRFYAPQPKDDPRDGLSSMFATSFSLSPSPEEQEARIQDAKGKTKDKNPMDGTVPNRTTTRVFELALLFAALYGWIFALDSGEHFARTVALVSVCAGLIVSIRLAADLEVDRQINGQEPSSILSLSLASLALGQVVAVLVLMWSIWSGTTLRTSGIFGNALFGGIITHQLWHIFA